MFSSLHWSHFYILGLFPFGIVTWVRQLRISWYLARRGKRRTAAVVDIHLQTLGDSDPSHTTYITTFMTPDTQTGRSLTFFRKTTQRPPYHVGQLVTVLIDPRNPSRYLILD